MPKRHCCTFAPTTGQWTSHFHALQPVALRQASAASSSAWLAEVQVALAESLLHLGDAKAARVLADKAQAIHAANVELALHFKAPLARLSEPSAQR